MAFSDAQHAEEALSLIGLDCKSSSRSPLSWNVGYQTESYIDTKNGRYVDILITWKIMKVLFIILIFKS